jgi:hypothetical protein
VTKVREPLTYQLTLTKVAALIGWDNCGAICGVSERSVRNWSDHDCQTEIRMIDGERLDKAYLAAGGTYAPFHHLLELRLEIAVRDASARELTSVAASAAKESGEALSALIGAAQNVGCRDTRRNARREVEEAIASLTDGLAALDRAEQGETHP